MNTKTAMEYEADTEEKIRGIKIGMMAHAIVFVGVSSLLTAINALVTPDELWAIYPVVGMSIGVVMHYIMGVYIPTRKFRSMI